MWRFRFESPFATPELKHFGLEARRCSEKRFFYPFFAASERIIDADELVIIGYALPIEDGMVRRPLMRCNASVTVVDRDTSNTASHVSEIGLEVKIQHGGKIAMSECVTMETASESDGAGQQ